ncbi:hypothetical protein LCGC14_1084490 [marine sediment metagenome]|uniref:Rad50/SbcC-type AAA domain-containing protein n=1 Tax=marine sediment metagenome TaxID=412755 RepID=A0A0F9N1T9_9ZZZZ
MVNIANIRGEENFEFNSGKLSLITGPNGSGKTKIINSIAAIESYPIKSESLIKEANKLGIFESLINNKENEAEIEISWNSIKKHLIIKKNGQFEIDKEGNEKFLYSNLLYPSSRLHETIKQKDPDFSWILKELSLAGNYDFIFEIWNSYEEQIDRYLEEIEKKLSNILEYSARLEDISIEKRSLNDQIKDVNDKIDKLKEVDPNIKKEYDELEEIIKSQSEEILEKMRFIGNVEKDINKKELNVKSVLNLIKENEKKLSELAISLNALKEISSETLQSKIINLMKEEKELILPQADLEKKIDKLRNQLEVEEDSCPLCDKAWEFDNTKLTKDLNVKLKEFNVIKSQLSDLSRKIKQNETKIKEKGKLRAIETEYKKKYDEIHKNRLKIQELQNKANKDRNKNTQFEKQLEKLMNNKKENEKRFNELSDIIAVNKEFKKLANNKANLTEVLGKLNQEENSIKIEIEDYSKIQLWEITEENDKASKVLNKLKEEIRDIRLWVKNKSDEQKQGVAVKFNDKIKNLLDDMNFEHIEQVMFDLEDFQLKAYTKGKVKQNIRTLSGAESGVILALLQISLKETYSTDSPFFLVDEVIHRLDENRQKSFLGYLKNLAEKNNWFIILTHLGGDKLEIIEY